MRALEVGPDYDGVPMLRRILTASRGIIVHSHYVERDIRNAGFEGPVAVIPHGAWIPDADRFGVRHKFGISTDTPLIGVFGFLKPYKRIAESLRAFKRILRVHPNARMILVGEPHPDFPLKSLIDGLGLQSTVRVLGFVPMEDFVGYIAACDVILNLRFPTVGESSGTLLRSLGLGRAVIVSNIGSFAEYPDEVCLKVPVDAAEEDTLYEYLNTSSRGLIYAKLSGIGPAIGSSASATGGRSRSDTLRLLKPSPQGRIGVLPTESLEVLRQKPKLRSPSSPNTS